MIVPFGEWLPDLPEFSNPGALKANNVYSQGGAYRPWPSLAAASSALNARVRGAIAATDASGNAYVYAGTADKLYEVRRATVTDKSKSGGYSTGALEGWEFTTYGETVIATNYDDAVQSITAGGGAFADLITSTRKPKARRVATVRDFVVLGDTNDSTDGEKQNRVWWSALDDPTDFDPSSTTLSDYQDLPDGGAVQAIVGGVEYGVIVMERAVQRMAFTGGSAIFRFDAVDRRRGTPIPRSVVGQGRMVYWISEEGFLAFDGSSSRNIGHNRVDLEFWDQFDNANVERVSAGIDEENKLVVWAFPNTSASNGVPNKLFIYNWADDRWTDADVDLEFLASLRTQSYTLEELDSVSSSIDTLTPSLDSPQWKGNRLRFAAFDTDDKIAYFTGSNLEATLDTGERQLAPGFRAAVLNCRPLVDGGTPTISIGHRDNLQDATTFDTAKAINAIGKAAVRRNARYHRFRVTVPAASTWTHAQGVQFDPNDIKRLGIK